MRPKSNYDPKLIFPLSLALYTLAWMYIGYMPLCHWDTLEPVLSQLQTAESPSMTIHPLLDPAQFKTPDGCDLHEMVQHFDPEDLPLTCANMHELEKGELVGHGNFRQVYKAMWNGRPVAIKELLPKFHSDAGKMQSIIKEVAVHYQLRHASNILELLGWCNGTVVLEYAPMTLDELIWKTVSEPFSVQRSIKLGLDVVRGIAQLHNVPHGPVAHGDIAYFQFLVAPDGRVLLGDFDLIEFTGTNATGHPCRFQKQAAYARGKWHAPEEKQRHFVDEKIDLYGAALLLWSLRARTEPFHQYNTTDTTFDQFVIAGERPSRERMSDYPPDLQQLIIRAWASDPNQRPSASEMVNRMEQLI